MNLAEQLHAHTTFDAHEERAKARILAHVEAGGALFDRARWDGHLTASAFIVDAVGEHLFMVFHRKLQIWVQPGGHGEPSETDPLAVARREALEETGIKGLTLHPLAPAPFDLDVHDIPARPGEEAHQHLDIRYLFVAPEGAQASLDLREVNAASWVPIAEVASSPDASIARPARKVAALLARHLA